MQLHLTDNKFDTNPYWSERIKSVFACPPKETVAMFDQNGYDLTKLEQLYAVANSAITTKHRNSEHITLRKDWFTSDDNEYGPHINHAYMFERKAYSGEALSQLETWAGYRPHFYKLTAMRPKWGLDFSIDYADAEGNVFEVLHWEWDSFDYKEIVEKKKYMDDFLQAQDFNEMALRLLDKKSEWHHLGFFEQSEYKTQFFGIEKERFKMVAWK